MAERTNEEIIEQIKSLIESHVKPAVASHGGNIEFISYDNGHLLLELGGACSGCAGSTMTLKFGVENMIKHYVPEVQTIDAQDDPFSTVNPFYSDDYGFAHWDTIPKDEVDNEPNN
jgi:Fe-S cluster biogenesis protein NfuA